MSLKVAYIPEHFSTPLHFAQAQGFYKQHGVEVEFIPVIEGSGRLIKLLNDNEVDIAIGLTEAFIADVAKGNDTYDIVATYVKSPLCWAISTGVNRDDITKPEDLDKKIIGVSRVGSGSYVMSFVLGLQLKLSEPFFKKFQVLSNFKTLRESVNLTEGVQPSDAFMWEHFTSKKYYDNGEIKRIGEIYTPWPSWVITSRKATDQKALAGFVAGVRQGIQYFLAHQDEAVEWIASNLDYSKEDASAWLDTVKFNEPVDAVDPAVVAHTSSVLQTAGVLTDLDDVINARLQGSVSQQSV